MKRLPITALSMIAALTTSAMAATVTFEITTPQFEQVRLGWQGFYDPYDGPGFARGDLQIDVDLLPDGSLADGSYGMDAISLLRAVDFEGNFLQIDTLFPHPQPALIVENGVVVEHCMVGYSSTNNDHFATGIADRPNCPAEETYIRFGDPVEEYGTNVNATLTRVDSLRVSYDSLLAVNQVPVPAGALLLLTGMGALGLRRKFA